MWLILVIYIAFISLGLPDSMLGSAWPSIHKALEVPESYAGVITAIIYTGTIISSVASGYLIGKFGTWKIVFVSVLLTAVAMFGFSISENYLSLCLIALPYGLGGGCIDAALNNYVALHYTPKHMNFLHCFWGIGTMVGPVLMGWLIASGEVWTQAYRVISLIQTAIAVIMLISFPLWKESENEEAGNADEASKGSYSLLLRPGIRGAVIAFFFYCAVESSLGLWTVSYMIDAKGVDIVIATAYGMLFYVGITIGRIIAGFMSERYSDTRLIVYGLLLIIVALLGLPLAGDSILLSYLMVVAAGVGCGPIFPSMLHRAPQIIGRENSQILIGAQMAAASLGSITVPALFGYVVHYFDISFLPVFCITMIIAMTVSLFMERPLKETSISPMPKTF